MLLPAADPFFREELRLGLDHARLAGGPFWSDFEPEVFFARIEGAWSPADNVRHLIVSNRPLARALRLAKVLLLLRFGPSRGRSLRFAEVVAKYRGALAAGLKAGRYTPRPLEPPYSAEVQTRLVADLGASLESVGAALGGWSERQLDWVRLPHPGMGLLTVREMVMFTIYHNHHHADNVARLIGGGPAAEAPGINAEVQR